MFIIKQISLLIVFFFITISANAIGFEKPESDTTLNTFNKDFIYNVKKMQSTIKIDGIIEESDWMVAQKADNFYRVLPIDTGFAYQQSVILMTYDDKALYLAQIFYDTIPGKRVMESFRRDFSFGSNDNLLVFFDTFLDQTNGFSFGVSASGAKWDGTMSDGHSISLDWDCKWESKTKHYDDRWVTEMRIPFKSIRYPKNSQIWNTNFSRLDLKSNEKSAWAPVPRQFPTASLAYTGVMKFDEPLPKSKTQFSLIPYIFGGVSKDYEAGTDAKYRKDFGFDAKIGISSSMNLDLTYNPDFSQVEVDEQIVNFDRFELFFPEKRQFFLENSDLFANFGYKNVTPFFSRRIGLDAPVLAGARLSGKIGNNLRIGLMNMSTRETDEHLARNFTVVSVQKKLFARSNIGFIVVNKEYFNQPTDTTMFNRVIGVDYNLKSKDNFWDGKFFYHRSFQPDSPDKQYSQGAMLMYSTKHIKAGFTQTAVGENYKAEVGFVQRTGYNYIAPEITYLFVPNKWIVSHGPTIELNTFFNPDLKKIEHENRFDYQINFSNRAGLRFGHVDFFVELQQDFDPTHGGDHYLPAGTKYDFAGNYIGFESTKKTLFNWAFETARGTFYDGLIHYFKGEIGYRFQPFINATLNFDYTDIDLPAPFERSQNWLIGPKIDVTFTDKLFWSTFVQYNEQIDNMNINMRLQWRYQPVSDIYLVYTDNYIPGSWTSRNRALVLKMTYWLN
ncbi:MAG: carbohydrate binding family 9 domain-containing protein [Draconibacterium sp.]|nr:carbohydrate binding family 9 domain-containing protein [Draconibacterium sp.]